MASQEMELRRRAEVAETRADDERKRRERAEKEKGELERQVADQAANLCQGHGAHNPEGDCFVCDTEQAKEAGQHGEDMLVLRRFQIYPVEVVTVEDLMAWTAIDDRDRLEAILERLEDGGAVQPVVTGADRPRWGLTTEGRTQAIENLERITGSAGRPPEDVDLLVDANERAERAKSALGESERELVAVTERAERFERALEAIRDLIEAEQRKDEIDQRLHLLVEQIDDIVRAKIAIDTGQRFLGAFSEGGEVNASLKALGVKPIKFERPGLFRGHPTEDGYRFERIGDDVGPDSLRLDEVEKLMLETKAAVEKAEHLAVTRGERAEELQALVDDVLPAVRELRELLDGDENPAWWVRATRCLDQLGSFESSILVEPPPAVGDDAPEA
jgi:hypothetical protein